MGTLQIGVVDPSQVEMTNMEVPDDVPVGALTEEIVRAMELPTTDADGRPVPYQLNLRHPDGRLTRLDGEQSLSQNNVQQNAALQLTAEMRTGP